MSASKGITGKVGRWSARHPWTAITLWIAFVAARDRHWQCCRHEAAHRGRVGQRRERRRRTHARQGRLQDPAGRAGARPVEDAARRATRPSAPSSATSSTRLDAHAERRQAALAVRAEHDLEGRPLGARLVRDPGHVRHASATRSRRSRPTTAAAQSAHPGFVIAEAGDGSFSKAYDDTQGKDFEKAEQLSLPITLLILVIAFGGLLIAGIPVRARHERGLRGARADRGREPAAAGHRRHAVGDPADRPRRRRRLLDLLHRP